MKCYWDTSAVINAFLSVNVLKRLDQGEHVTRLHTFAEFFATMTGRGVMLPDQAGNVYKCKLSAGDCAAWLRTFAAKIQVEGLSTQELLDGLDQAQKLNVQGGHVYDNEHALACKKAKADELLTRNTDDFKDLAEKVAWP